MSTEIKNKFCPLCKVMPLATKNTFLFCSNCNVYAGREHTYEKTFESASIKAALKEPFDYHSMHHKKNNTRWYATAFALWYAATMIIMVFSSSLALF